MTTPSLSEVFQEGPEDGQKFTLRITKAQAQSLEHAILELTDKRDPQDAEYYDDLEAILTLLTPIVGVGPGEGPT